MERAHIEGLAGPVGRAALGTWSMGGWMWGGPDATSARATIERALDSGIDLIDTAPAYGFGLSERLVGEVLASHPRGGDVRVATKCGLVWDGDEEPRKDASPESILWEVEQSRRRLGRDVIDLYQIHWPDPRVRVERTAECLNGLLEKGVVRAVGVCNFDAQQMASFAHECPLSSVQSPYNVFQRAIESDVLPQARSSGCAFLAYSPLARGLLTGKIRPGNEPTEPARRRDMFHGDGLARRVRAVDRLDDLAKERFGVDVLHLALRWILDGVDDSIVLWGARRPEQLDGIERLWGWRIDPDTRSEIERIVFEELTAT